MQSPGAAQFQGLREFQKVGTTGTNSADYAKHSHTDSATPCAKYEVRFNYGNGGLPGFHSLASDSGYVLGTSALITSIESRLMTDASCSSSAQLVARTGRDRLDGACRGAFARPALAVVVPGLGACRARRLVLLLRLLLRRDRNVGRWY